MTEEKIEKFHSEYCNIIDYNEYIKMPLTERPKFLEKKGIYTKFHNMKEKNYFSHAINKNLNLYFGLNGYDHDYIYRVKENIICAHYNYLEQEIKTYENNALKNLEFQLNLFRSVQEKKDFLSSNKNKNIKKINKKWQFQFFCGKKSDHYTNWKDYIIRQKDFTSSLFKIFCGFITLPLSDKMMQEWKKIAEVKAELNFCERELEKLSHLNKVIKNKTDVLTSNERLILFEKIRCIDIEVWENLDNAKKARLISKITGYNDENIRKNIPNLDKSEDKLTIQFKKDILKAELILKSILG